MSFACVGDISIYFTVSSLIIKPIFFLPSPSSADDISFNICSSNARKYKVKNYVFIRVKLGAP